jgi:ABC-2 type transport system permease protein
MRKLRSNLRTDVRIIWAIAAKDISGALKNKNALTVLLSVLFLVSFYRFMPALTGRDDETPILRLYDAGESELVTLLDNSSAVKVYTYPSEEDMTFYLTNADVPQLGLVIPAGFDESLAAGQALRLQGYTLYWVSGSESAELRQFAELHIAELLDAPVEIQTAGNTVHMRPESRGLGLTASLGIVFATTVIGISFIPHIILDERQSRTMDALLVSPASSAHIALAKALTGLFYGILTIGVSFAINSSLITQWWLAILAAFVGSLFPIALGLLLGTLVKTRQELTLWGWGFILPLFVPAILVVTGDLFPAWVLRVCEWVPTVALFELLRVSFSTQTAFALVVPRLALMFGATVIVMILVARRLQRADR